MHNTWKSAKVLPALALLVVMVSCGDGGARETPDTIEGVWNFSAYVTDGSWGDKLLGKIDFRKGGVFFETGYAPDGSIEETAGGDWSKEGSVVSIHYTWSQFDGKPREDYDGATYVGEVTGGSGVYLLYMTDGEWVIEISR
ncbi:MAG: hypothetical protein OEZ55_08790 [Nitrospinota bacterium]|nr:hypothetical protein [Nitrospinota bacterium]MDH5756748.1 hypothetical protein [Nitrospinota bacterium]